MGARAELSLETRGQILAYRKTGLSYEKIAKIIGCAKSTVFRTIARFDETNSLKSKARSGRRSKITQSGLKYIKNVVKRDRKITVRDMQAQYNECTNDPVSFSCIQRALAKLKLRGRVAAKKPLLSKKKCERSSTFRLLPSKLDD